MFVQQLYTGCLSEAAYYIESNGEAAIVDPLRDIDVYLQLAAEREATIKYILLLSPLYIAHVYKHKDNEDYDQDIVSATGIKLKIDSFLLDVHQRREWFDTLSRSKSEQLRTSAMKINRAQLDFVNADLRAVSAAIAGTTAEDLKKASDDMLACSQEMPAATDLSKFTIPDHDFSWIDMDDFVELDWILPAEANPETKILPLAFTPRFTYFRETDHGDAIHGSVKSNHVELTNLRCCLLIIRVPSVPYVNSLVFAPSCRRANLIPS